MKSLKISVGVLPLLFCLLMTSCGGQGISQEQTIEVIQLTWHAFGRPHTVTYQSKEDGELVTVRICNNAGIFPSLWVGQRARVSWRTIPVVGCNAIDHIWPLDENGAPLK